MIGQFKLALVAGAVVVTCILVWLYVVPLVEGRSVSWYMAHSSFLVSDYVWCRDHPGASSYWKHPGISCQSAIEAKDRSDADAFLRAAAAAAKQR
jgi:hypothetical protein